VEEKSRLPLGLGLLGVALSLAAAFVPRFRHALLVVVVAAVGAAVYLGVPWPKRERAVVQPGPKPGLPRLAALLPLRRAIAAGTGGIDAAFRQIPPKGLARDVAMLWKAQADLQQMHIDDAARALGAFASPSQTPLVEILRARLAFFQAKEVDAVVAY